MCCASVPTDDYYDFHQPYEDYPDLLQTLPATHRSWFPIYIASEFRTWAIRGLIQLFLNDNTGEYLIVIGDHAEIPPGFTRRLDVGRWFLTFRPPPGLTDALTDPRPEDIEQQ